jgi:hypothetical protein
MQIGRFLKKGAEKFITDPVRGVGRIARGDVRQGLRDMSGAVQAASMFVPGGAMVAGGLGALGGAMGAGKGASFGDVAGRAALGGAAGVGGQAMRKGFQSGMADGGGIGGGLKNLFTGGGGGAGGGAAAPGGQEAQSMLGRLGGAAQSVGRFAAQPQVAAGIARGAADMYGGNQASGIRQQELDLMRSRFDEERRQTSQEEERRRMIAQLLAPMWQDMQSRSSFGR